MPIFNSFDDFLLRTGNLYEPRLGKGVTTIKLVDRVVANQRMMLVRFRFEHNQQFLLVMTPDEGRTRTVALRDNYGDIVFMEKTTAIEKVVAVEMIEEYKTGISIFA